MIGIIGGTGLYQLTELEDARAESVVTPFGAPSSEITIGRFRDKDIAFLPRHGARHQLLPSEVNYRANIWALKVVGVRAIVGISAVGSLRTDITPGTLVLSPPILKAPGHPSNSSAQLRGLHRRNFTKIRGIGARSSGNLRFQPSLGRDFLLISGLFGNSAQSPPSTL